MFIENKIKQAVQSNKLNPKILGERQWYSYSIRITELIWSRNLRDGYKIEVYSKKYGEHFSTIYI